MTPQTLKKYTETIQRDGGMYVVVNGKYEWITTIEEYIQLKSPKRYYETTAERLAEEVARKINAIPKPEGIDLPEYFRQGILETLIEKLQQRV